MIIDETTMSTAELKAYSEYVRLKKLSLIGVLAKIRASSSSWVPYTQKIQHILSTRMGALV